MIRIDSRPSPALYREYLFFEQFQSKFYRLGWLLMQLFCLALLLATLFVRHDLVFILLTAAVILLDAVLILRVVLGANAAVKKELANEATWPIYLFDEGVLSVANASDGIITEKYAIEKLKKVYETKRLFVVFPTDSIALIVSKEHFVLGDPAQLHSALKAALPKKRFITCL